MTKEAIEKACAAAREFLRRVDALEVVETGNDVTGRWVWVSPKSTGAIRRQSMELTRALADMRRAG